ncbi:MAG: type III restriction enzyme, res subunit [Mycoplasmataceae bacterium RC_NB112A]|nr:MAG: type III restriction enzyme, res subunit [Mycoplasmataceae bacterium RC_NB112A]
MHDNFEELLKLRKSLKMSIFGFKENEISDQNRVNVPENSDSQLPNLLNRSDNSLSNDFTPQDFTEREKQILQASQEVIPFNKIKEKFIIKILRQKIQPHNFSLRIIEIKGLNWKFKKLGEKFISQKEIKNLLQRYKIEVDPQQKLSWKTTEDEEFLIEATQQFPQEERLKSRLISLVFQKCSFINSANPAEISSAGRLVESFLQVGDLEIISQYCEAAGEQLAQSVQNIFKDLQVGENQLEQKVIEKNFGYFHPSCEIIAKSLEEEVVKKDKKGYQFKKSSLYTYDTFDSNIELQFARLIDKTPQIKKWIRLLQWGNEIYILYGKKQQHYFPDFLVIDENDIHWLVEIKDDNDPNPEIAEKNQSAKEWVNALNLELGEEERKNQKWRFLYITKGSMLKSHENWNISKEFCRI